MKNILITGGAGFIGSHTCLSLLQKDYRIFVVDSFINSSPQSLCNIRKIIQSEGHNPNNLHIYRGDIKNKELLETIFLEAKNLKSEINGVIHFAALKSVSESVSNPLNYWDSNVYGTICLLEVMKANECKTIVFSSSATVYGLTQNLPLDENTIINPINPYGSTKMAIERLLYDIYNSSENEWRIANMRYFNPIGAHDSGLIGEDPLGIPNNIFPLITRVAAGLIKELKIFGNNWPTKDGTGVRDYIHVMDLAEGHIIALEYLFKSKPKIINLNLGTGKGTSVLELINTFEKVNNINIPYVFSNKRVGDSPYVVADNALATRELNWSPKRDLQDMCRDGWKWQSQNLNGYKKIST